MSEMHRAALLCAALVMLAAGGCGVGELGASAAAGGASKAEEAEEARNVQARVKRQLEEAAAEAASRREAIDAAAQ